VLHEEGRVANTLKATLSSLFENPPPARIVSTEFIRFLLGLAADLASDATLKRLKRCEGRLDDFCALEFVPLDPEGYLGRPLTSDDLASTRKRKDQIIAEMRKDILRQPGQRDRAFEVAGWYLMASFTFKTFWGRGRAVRERRVSEFVSDVMGQAGGARRGHPLERYELLQILGRGRQERGPGIAARAAVAIGINKDPDSVARTVKNFARKNAAFAEALARVESMK
jgi:hypothetical protein